MLKVKEMKENAIINIQVNRAFYIMVKSLAFNLLDKLIKEKKSEEYIAAIGTKDYTELDDDQRSVRTATLIIAEIEAQSKIQNQFEEKEVLEPGDEGYVAPTIED
jgi:hypothetical protein